MIGDKHDYCPQCGTKLSDKFFPDQRGNKLCSEKCRVTYEEKETRRIHDIPDVFDFHLYGKDPPDM